jgi:hypothetical protein
VFDGLQVRIWCVFAPIPLLAAVVLWLGVASSDSFGDPVYCNLHNLVRGLHGDRTPLQLVELLLPRLAPIRPSRGGSDAGLRRCSCPPWVGYRPVLLPLSIQLTSWAAERVVLPAEQHHRTIPGGYR